MPDTPTADQLAAGIEAVTVDLAALTDRVRTLFDIADHVPAVNEEIRLWP